jgi:hypothetical protein
MKHVLVLATATALALLSACAPYAYRDGYYGDRSYDDGYYGDYYGTTGGSYPYGYRDRYGRPPEDGPGDGRYGRYRYDDGGYYRRY